MATVSYSIGRVRSSFERTTVASAKPRGFRPGALLAECPSDGVHYVALSAAVRPDEGGQAGFEGELSLVGKGLEPVKV